MAEGALSVSEIPEATGLEAGRHGDGPSRSVTGLSAGRIVGQTNLLSRITSMLPSSVSLKPNAEMVTPQASAQSSVSVVSGVPKQTQPPPRPLKVRIVTWNMHDTLPKGNLEDLLGTVAPYVPYPEGETDKFRIPNMTLEDCHPYHLIIVAGQECPTVSGIPMGLAAGLRGKEKDKHKDSPNATPAVDSQHQSGHGPSSGWSWILESWFCRGAGERNNEDETTLASDVYDSQPAPERPVDPEQEYREGLQPSKDEAKEKKEKAKKRKHCSKKWKTGPYELLAKERLMGIYMAVFIYRDLKPLVRGLSKSAVTAGLIGGRLGNKGAAGISINLDGTTLLFVNAHLAAHEERVMDRVANMAKIKSQMQVDDYLDPNDPRFMAEDLMDRFDYTFVFGDLNFRLDITRKHADWLISRQAYDQALAFDQLRNIMAERKAFVGFHEGDINFPPTFKYDVFRSLKRDKSRLSKENSKGHAYYKRWRAHLSAQSLSRLDEQNDQRPNATSEANSGDVGEAEEKSNAFTDNEDSGSVISAAVTTTSAQSRRTDADDEDEESDVYFAQPLIARANSKSRAKLDRINAAHKPFITKAALKAKDKWMSLVSPKKEHSKSFHFVRKISRAKRSSAAVSATTMPPLGRSTSGTSQLAAEGTPRTVSAVELGQTNEVEASELRRSPSKKSGKSSRSAAAASDHESTKTADVDDRRGVYDSSSKQRVPSWCDRILWKSTVKPDPEPDEETADTRLGFGPRFLQFVSQPFRTRSRGSTTQLAISPPVEPVRTTSFPPKSLKRPATAPPGSGFVGLSAGPSVSAPPAILEKNATYAEGESLAELVHQRRWLRTKASLTKLTKSKSVEPETHVPRGPLDPRTGLRRGRSFSAQTPTISRPFALDPEDGGTPQNQDMAAASVPTPNLNTTGTNTPFPRRFFPFFYRDSDTSTAASEAQSTSKSLGISSIPRHRKGDVVVLGYRTLDDPGMRRLEGRSDHRPVIGSYALYI